MTEATFDDLGPVAHLILGDRTSHAEPFFTLLTGGPGSTPARAIARLIDAHGDQVVVVDPAEIEALSDGGQGAVAVSLMALRQARDRRLSVLAVLPPDERIALQIAQEFGEAGYKTRAVVCAGQIAQDLLAVVSAELRGIRSLGAADSYDNEWAATRRFMSFIAQSKAVDEVAVMSGSGELSPVATDDAAALFDEVRAQPMSNLQAVAWLGELRRLTEYALSTEADRSASGQRDPLVRLHDVALTSVLPQLPIDPSGLVARTQIEALKAQRAQLTDPRHSSSTGPLRPPTEPGLEI